jgi:bifunctional DNase/RNase
VAPPTVELRVADVRTAVPAGAGVEAGLVVLEEVEAPGRLLRIVIGQPEARAIYGPWKGIEPPRPTTWDLFVSTIELLGGAVREVVITSVEERRHFFATMELVQGDVTQVVPCRPSDAFALALRSSGARIVTTDEVMEAAGVSADGSGPGSGAASADVVADEAPAPPSRRMVAGARRVRKAPAPEMTEDTSEPTTTLLTEPAESAAEPAVSEPATSAAEPAASEPVASEPAVSEPAASEPLESAAEPVESAAEPAASAAEHAAPATVPVDEADLTS